jgi:hypothetical protein
MGWRGPLRAGEGGRRPGSLRGLKEKERRKGLAGLRRKERGEGVKVFLFFKKFFSNSFFKLSILQSNRNPCIRIMMHKHLLFLNYFSDI